MPDRSETLLNGRTDVLNRLRDARPPDAWMLAGYAGEGPPGFDRVWDPSGLRYVDVPSDRILDRHPVPADDPDSEPGIVLFVQTVEPNERIQVHRITPADLLEGPILTELERIVFGAKCYTVNTRTPRHNPFTGWLDPDFEWPDPFFKPVSGEPGG